MDDEGGDISFIYSHKNKKAVPEIGASLLHTTQGHCFPLFARYDETLFSGLTHWFRARPFSISSISGTARAVAYIDRVMALPHILCVRYKLMVRNVHAHPQGGDPQISSIKRMEHAAEGAILLRPAHWDDIDALIPLQAAYMEEEVMRENDGKKIGESALTRKGIVRQLHEILTTQYMVVAEREHRNKKILLGKAATNARGFRYCQIGGLFVEPHYRSKGIGTMLMKYLLHNLETAGFNTCLYVKSENEAAVTLYQKLQYEECDEFVLKHY